SLNGNFMLNIGPRANGDVQHEVSQRMLEMGRWLDVNGEAIYGAEAFDLDNYMHDWGKITFKQNSQTSKLFLHVFNWPLSKKLFLTGVESKPEKIYLLADKQQKSLQFTHMDVYTEIDLPHLEPDPYVSVVVLEYSQKPETRNGLVAKNTDNGYALTPVNNTAINAGIELQPKSRRGTVPEHATVDQKQTLKWKIYIDQPGDKHVDVSYSFQGTNPGGKIRIKADNDSIVHEVQPTGKTVGEPNASWIIDNFKSFSAGTMNFPKKGVYEVEAEIAPPKGQEVHFQWIWIK
ncbi:MAG: alpha-L-fucosidase, partial [Bacteroidota bacterium]